MSSSEKCSIVDAHCPTFSIARQCSLLGLSRSRFYYKPKGLPEGTQRMIRHLDKLYLEDPTRGTRRMTKELQRMGFSIGRRKVRSLMRLMRLKTVYCKPRTTIIDKASYKFPYLLRNLEVKRSNQVWAVDITYVPMRKGHLYLFAIIDLKSRLIVNWSLSNSMEADWVVTSIREAVQRYGAPEIINSDQGSQFTSDQYVHYIKGLKTTRISMDGKGRAIDNIFIERFWRTIKYDKLYLFTIEDGHHAERLCNEFIQYYNHRRMHSSIDDMTPIQAYHKAA